MAKNPPSKRLLKIWEEQARKVIKNREKKKKIKPFSPFTVWEYRKKES